MPKTSLPEVDTTSALKEVRKILSTSNRPTMEDHEDAKEMKHSSWSKMSVIELWTSLQKKKKSPPMWTTSLNRSFICSCNINYTPVEPNSMISIPSACYICKSEIMLEEWMVNEVTMGYFHFALCYVCLDWMIWKLGLSLPAFCIECSMYRKRIYTCHLRILPSWVRKYHSSKKSC